MLKNNNHKRRYYYLLFAIAFGIFWYLFKLGGVQQPLRALFSTIIDIFFSLAALIITVELLLPQLFYKQRYKLFAFCLPLIILITGSLTVVSQLGLMGYTLAEFYSQNIAIYIRHYYYWFWSDLVLGSYFMISFISLAGFAIRLSFDRISAARDMEVLEKEMSRAELEMLKNQINPHFLFNALNTIYYKIDRVNIPARQMVEQFSSLLRYQLYECNTTDVEIEKELKFITDYIELQKERMSQYVQVNYDDLKKVKGFSFAPFILMPLVENCFKHVSQYPGKENSISVCSAFNDGWFWFETVNTIGPTAEESKTGIGLENVRKRLELIYPGKHSLCIKTSDDLFTLTLKISTK